MPARRPLVTLESQTPVGEFDVIAFSVSFEWDYVNVLTLLRLAGIPRYARRAHRAPSARRHRRRGDVREPRAAGAVCRRDRRGRRRSARAGASSALPAATGTRRAAPPALARARLLHAVVLRAAARLDGTLAGYRDRRGRNRCAGAGAEGRAQDDGRARSAGDEHLHARHRVRLALPHRGRARLREPVPLLLGRLQLPAGPRVSDRAHSAARARGADAFEPRRARVDRALRPPGHRAHPRAPERRWATPSARRRCASTT